MYEDINKHTGLNTAPLEHLRQSMADILTTPLFTRLKRRTYGSELPALVDSADNASNRLRLYNAAATALMTHEPRLHLSRIQITSGARAGSVQFSIDGSATINGQVYSLQAVTVPYRG